MSNHTEARAVGRRVPPKARFVAAPVRAHNFFNLPGIGLHKKSGSWWIVKISYGRCGASHGALFVQALPVPRIAPVRQGLGYGGNRILFNI